VLRQQLYVPHMEQEMVVQAALLLTFCADFHRMRRWLRISGARDNFDHVMSFMIDAIDAVLASQNAALAAEGEGLGICYMGYPAEDPPLRDRLRRKVEESGVGNLAQVYTAVKDMKASHREFSEKVLRYLDEQRFMN
jgi:hypothetical protein